MKRLVFFGVIGLFMAISSCDPAKQFEAELAQIDSLQIIVDELENKYDEVNFDSLKIMVDHVKQNEKEIKLYYRPDTLNETLGRQMNESKGIRKSLTNLDEKKMAFGDEINAIKHQFINLKSDITEGLLTQEEIKGYIDIERDALRAFERNFLDFYELQKLESLVYYVTVPEVDKFIAELKNKTNKTVD